MVGEHTTRRVRVDGRKSRSLSLSKEVDRIFIRRRYSTVTTGEGYRTKPV